MAELSIIIPFCNEWPLIATTIRSVGQAMEDTGIDFEVIAVDNWMPEVGEQVHPKTGQRFGKDRGHGLVKSLSIDIPWLRVFDYHEKLSHWNAKNLGAKKASSDILLFMDAHCLAPKKALTDMFYAYQKNWRVLNGSIHLPVTYHILEEKALIYSLRWRPELADLDYTFSAARIVDNEQRYYEVPCMSTCGMMIHRRYLDKLGWWPSALGIYGGGEHWLNYSMAITWMKKWIFGDRPLYHHGDVRGYRWNGLDYERNRLIAIYLWGDARKMRAFADKRKFGSKRIMSREIEKIICDEKLLRQKKLIDSHKMMEIEEFISKWNVK